MNCSSGVSEFQRSASDAHQIVGRPCKAPEEYGPKIATLKDGSKSWLVSQFMLELQKLKAVDGEDPSRVFAGQSKVKG
ncbi:hypothetical protein AMTR_s00084p00049540 [Amborella trichopoda]|uniref:Uncharacterized protein n=1 Tax=Amborella trichopoda TaxID=13333 RepID=W1P2Z5_AMBTC|nr:hypothetical protein AMTR_s00084p00049540 [Amborella trichopoda]